MPRARAKKKSPPQADSPNYAPSRHCEGLLPTVIARSASDEAISKMGFLAYALNRLRNLKEYPTTEIAALRSQ